MSTSPTPFAKRVLYYSIMVVVLLLIVELLSRAYYYQYLSPRPIAFVQVAKDLRDKARAWVSPDLEMERLEKAQRLVRPGLSQTTARAIVRELRRANRSVYQPWVEFAFQDFHGNYLNVTDRVRRSIPDGSDSTEKNPFTIFFIGGSTTFGFGVTDSETIPSCFVRAYRQTHPNGRPIRVVNLGMPFYYSYQELIQIADLLFRDEKPDMMIMLDGVNDCLDANDAYKRAPAFAIGKGNIFRPDSKEDTKQQLADYPNLPAGLNLDSASKMISRRYLDNIRHAHDLAALYHIPLYCFWQPVPYYDYPNRSNDPICIQTSSPRFEHIYPLVRTGGAALPWFFYLGDMLEKERGFPFIDQIHYSPKFSQAIAEKMLSLISL